MKGLTRQVGSGVAAALLLIAVTFSVFILVGSVELRLGAADSFCATRLHMMRGPVWLSFYTVVALGLTGSFLADKCLFYPKTCRLVLIAGFLTSIASLILIGNE